MKNLRYLIGTFSRTQRLNLAAVLILQLLAALLDLLGVAVVLPLMQSLTQSDLQNGLLGRIYSAYGSPDPTTFSALLAGTMIVAFGLKAIVATGTSWISLGLVAKLQSDTAERVLDGYLKEDYLRHRKRDTSEILSTVGPAVQMAHTNVIGGLISITSAVLPTILVCALLFAVAPLPSLASIAYIMLTVGVVQRVLSPANRSAGQRAQDAARETSRALIDAAQGHREVTLHQSRPFFLAVFDRHNRQQTESARKANFLTQLPKQILEFTTMSGIALLIIVTVATNQTDDALPILSLFVAAAIKILPLMVNLTVTLGLIRVGTEGLAVTVHALQDFADHSPADTQDAEEELEHDADLHLKGVSFTFPDSQTATLQEISATIPFGSSVAICGPTGSGKSTLANAILGLLEPSAGTISYGEKKIQTAINCWQKTIAYVPQDVFLRDASIADNIVFGEREEADDARLHLAIRQAQLLDLVSALPNGLETPVGERGTRLSGGQRQRIGLARALYRNPAVIVLDEATSALDNQTEERVTSTLRALHGSVTTILIAHRLSSVRHVDTLMYIENGHVQAMGSFAEVVKESPEFARAVALGALTSPEASNP